MLTYNYILMESINMNFQKLITKFATQIQGAYYALTDGNIKASDLLQLEYYINNIDLFIQGPASSAAKSIRYSYNEEINKIKDNYLTKFQEIHVKYMSFTPNLAIEVSNARDEIKLAKQAETPFIGRQQIYARNLEKYGDKNGPSKEYKLKQLESNPEVFAYKALMTDGKDLGLSGNGFSETVNNWINIKDSNIGVYPEDSYLLGESSSIPDLFEDTVN